MVEEKKKIRTSVAAASKMGAKRKSEYFACWIRKGLFPSSDQSSTLMDALLSKMKKDALPSLRKNLGAKLFQGKRSNHILLNKNFFLIYIIIIPRIKNFQIYSVRLNLFYVLTNLHYSVQLNFFCVLTNL